MNYLKKNYKKIVIYFTVGHERSLRAKKNIILIFLYKGSAALIGLLIVPLTLHFLDSVKYGIWLTLSSIMGWIYFFDVGLGNGLRNKFAEAKANSNNDLAKGYVSTAYAGLFIVVGLIFLIFIIINKYLNWTKILNAPENLKEELNLLVIVSFSFFCMGLVIKLIDTILIADQRPGTSSFILLICNIFILGFIYLLTKTTSSSLLLAGIILSAASILIWLFASVYFYMKDYREVRPSIRNINWNYGRELMSLGTKFFVIQISVLVIFTSSNIVITQLFGPAQVTIYNIAYKYFSIVIMIFSIITTPFWSAFTEAYVKKDFEWIKKTTNKLIKMWFFFSIIMIIMVIISNSVYAIWIGREFTIPISITIFMGIYTALLNLSNIFTAFINGTGKIKIQLYLAILMGSISVPLMIFLASTLALGVTGIILAICISVVPFLIFLPLQYYKILNNKAFGIWAK